MRLKFLYETNGDGGNVYIDDINLGWYLGVNEAISEQFQMNVSPNPVTMGNVNINYQAPVATKIKFSIYNSLGQKIQESGDINSGIGEQNFNFDAHDLANGVYYVRMESNYKTLIKNLLLNRTLSKLK